MIDEAKLREDLEGQGFRFESGVGQRPIRVEAQSPDLTEIQAKASEFADRFGKEGQAVLDELRREIAEKPLATTSKAAQKLYDM